jgi:hypothetical protein
MSVYEEALKEWKQRDPHLLDLDGFERFLAEKEKQVKAAHGAEDAYWERNRYCEERLMDIAIKAVLESEFSFPPKTWDEFFELAHRYMKLAKWKGYNLSVDCHWFHAICKELAVKGELGKAEVRGIWRRIVKHPEWYYDWNTALGAKGFTGSEGHLSGLLAICVKLGRENEASEMLNNLPAELRYLGDVPEHIKEYVLSESWKKTYDSCKKCTSQNCTSCVETP